MSSPGPTGRSGWSGWPAGAARWLARRVRDPLLDLIRRRASHGLPSPPSDDYLAHAGEAMAVLQRWYRRSTGLWQTAGWWNAANLLTTTIDYATVAGSAAWHDMIATTFERNRLRYRSNFCNDYYDDAGWWALAWLRAWDLTGQDRYLDTARTIFADLTEAWDDTCGGGVWWSRERGYKNAIANELFLAVAVGLHLRLPPEAGVTEHLDWAKRSWDWFVASGMRNDQGLINDGLRDCVNNGLTTWTYNQGVILGALVALREATGDTALLRHADDIADAAITTLIDANGVLTDPTPRPDQDQVQFKGVFTRNLGTLYQATGHDRHARFLRHNADAILTHARDSAGRLAFTWSGPPTHITAATHGSALDTLIAAARTKPRHPQTG
jgi:predicted alpha-1,6-mannanase (GH76 family)